MTDLDNERKAFEEAYLSVGGKQRDLELEDGEYTNSKSQLGWELWQIKAKVQAVPETQQKLTDTYYLEGSDYVVDCPFEYDIEIDKGEVLELQKWQRTESTKVYFANIYKDEDNFEILQFASKAEAENAVAENLKFLEASESGAEQ
ncbi:hypothetical protein N4T36_07245 [Acinetobacter baumannii]|uniref:hypothetical protein n=1 Tax=Acinetobacter baumannii TaxID=470 RepID=UPI0002BB804B|nr:hypothetical protein [Acinetobacter baumannii]AXX40836.1 hypothetical protein Aba9201_07240 [Acinetobacter baumannii]EKT8001270.1 hypothetical protein [Acinetobacter baumannii]EKU1730574.1 hypothetical protein [Acinetobacter baumannii]EKV2311463.1 hypothetical protein [Acinetobacter baumannii]EKV2432089.1 hypothetical protein [Acinetobacter baumannii]